MATPTTSTGHGHDEHERRQQRERPIDELALADEYVLDRHGERVALLTIEQAAGFLKVSRRTFFRLRATYDDFPAPVRWLERGVRYLETDIADWALRRMRGGAAR